MMKKLLYVLLLCFCLFNSSCTMVVKSLSKSIAKNYDDQTERNISGLVLTDEAGKSQTFASLFAGKTVYLYGWKSGLLLPPGDKDSAYVSLKRRFIKYDDVVFINLYNGEKPEDWKKVLELKNKGVKSYQLAADAENQDYRDLMGISTSPQIIGKNGTILSFQGPMPTDKIFVDYTLYQARNGQDGTASSTQMIKGINSKLHFKNRKLADWYQLHYGKKPGKLAVSISNSGSRVSL